MDLDGLHAYRKDKSSKCEQAIVLSQTPLGESASWEIRPPRFDGCNWIALGVISLKKVRKWKFCLNESKEEKACILPWNGASLSAKEVKAGKPFQFLTDGEMLRMVYSKEMQELRFEKKSGEWCVMDTSDEAEVYACAIIQSVGKDCGVHLC